MDKKNRNISKWGLTAVIIIFLLCSSLSWTQDNSQTKTEYGSTVTISGPFTVPPNQSYDIVLSAVTDAPIYQWAFYSDGNFVAGSGFVFGHTLDKAYSFTQTEAGSHTYLLRFRGIMGAHGWPPYTEVSITVDIALVDTTPPVITIINPYQCANYDWAQQVSVNYYVTDPESGIKEVSSRIDTTVVQNNTNVQASSLGYGNHILIVRAVNNAGLEAIAYVTFKVNLSPDGMANIIDSYVANGSIDNKGIGQSLKAKLPSPTDNPTAAVGKLNAFINEVNVQNEKHIDAETTLILLLYAKSQIAQIAPPLADLPQTLPYVSKLNSYAKVTLPNYNQVITIPLGRSEYTIQFNATIDPNIIGFTILNYQTPSASFQIDGHNVIYTAWQDPNNPSTGTIDLASCGLVAEHISNLFTLTVDSQTYGPYPLTMDLVGVQQWPDIYTAYMYLYGVAEIPSDVHLLGDGKIEMTGAHCQKYIEWVSVAAQPVEGEEKTWTIIVDVKLTTCGIWAPPAVTASYTCTGPGWETPEALEDGFNGIGVRRYRGTLRYTGTEPSSCTITVTVTPLTSNPWILSPVTVTWP
ncbi:MAG: hypothetical protein AB1599_03155 [Planctomycetota bacterium]